ncbi:uncharacterized protein LOC110841977 isoform X1 [Folsomia candida]|uniref:uncharacterized protein LOC110841977 isoform X1 n=1 Tax=Folsomia candida TaxID=158441 RepID=UPI001605352B|nr:uncharacterized protein LOC110841977 isoform X1 [Folsomia candida]
MGKLHQQGRQPQVGSGATSSNAKKNVQSAAEKLHELGSLKEFVRLKSIQSMLHALDLDIVVEPTKKGRRKRKTGESDDEGEAASADKDNASPAAAEMDSDPTTKEERRESGTAATPEELAIVRPGDCDADKTLIILSKVSRSCRRIVDKFCFFPNPRKLSTSNFFGVFFSILAFIFYFELHTTPGFTRMWLKWENVELRSVECTIESPHLAMELFRPPVACSICHNVTSVDRVSNISPKDFERLYAYSGTPVVVTDAMRQWSAASSFNFGFFKGIYEEGSRSLEHLGEDCLFFPYATEFHSLAEVFNMSQERYQEPWYIGWSNCDADTSHILRQHYHRPYFLPERSESTHADWLFMGTPGYGAHMHIDHVINPSWQAQIKGKKRWFLQPPPECFYECQSLSVDVQPGDIITLNTNWWYHQTQILPGEVSITIGSEYD